MPAVVKLFFAWLKDVFVEVWKQAVNTPKYTASTRAESPATPDEEEEVKERIKGSDLWEEIHK
jgi:hypothetical protein